MICPNNLPPLYRATHSSPFAMPPDGVMTLKNTNVLLVKQKECCIFANDRGKESPPTTIKCVGQWRATRTRAMTGRRRLMSSQPSASVLTTKSDKIKTKRQYK